MMTTVHTQLHGYRQGHQLLDSTVRLPKIDQSTVDRLSDVAGPLRPGELFDPYLSAYPLPSGQFYVFARTWQDLTIPRAGCVRTLSLVIDTDKWQGLTGLQPFLDFLDPRKFPTAAVTVSVTDPSVGQFPQAPEFRASELLEALFLEDQKPVALFDAPSPEIIAIRLLTALWPAFRRRFALSTFALSPRKIEGQYFDLVFAPKDARVKFTDWPGRRIDARVGTAARHRWTDKIVDRVFRSAKPWLLSDREIRQFGEEEWGAPAALRIALLWEELLAKLSESPSAALGLLDIANSKMDKNFTALHALQPALAGAAKRAVEILPTSEAWDFLRAMIGKIIGTPIRAVLHSVTDAARLLAVRSPSGAISVLNEPGREDVIDAIVPAIAHGLATHYGSAAELAIMEAGPLTFRRLVVANPQLARAALANPILIGRLEDVVGNLGPAESAALRSEILPALVDDRHASLAGLFFSGLDVTGILAEVKHLNQVNGFKAKNLLRPLIERARQLSAIEQLRWSLLAIPTSSGRDVFLQMTFSPSTADVWWLLRETKLSKKSKSGFLRNIVAQASVDEFHVLMADDSLAPVLLEQLSGMRDILLRAITERQLSLTVRIHILLQLLPESSESQRRELATELMDDCLRTHFGGDELATLSALFHALGPAIDGGWVVRVGLGCPASMSIVNRNLVVFNKAPNEGRHRILGAIEDLAEELVCRWTLDLNEEAAAACAELLIDAQTVNFPGLLRGAGRLLPNLFRSTHMPVSAIVAATFPLVYRELAKGDDVPSILKILPFVDWDRCKAARRQLVELFLSSGIWKPCDLALTACRSMDAEKILQCVAKSHHGEIYLSRISGAIKMLPEPCRSQIRQTIDDIRSTKSEKHH